MKIKKERSKKNKNVKICSVNSTCIYWSICMYLQLHVHERKTSWNYQHGHMSNKPIIKEKYVEGKKQNRKKGIFQHKLKYVSSECYIW